MGITARYPAAITLGFFSPYSILWRRALTFLRIQIKYGNIVYSVSFFGYNICLLLWGAGETFKSFKAPTYFFKQSSEYPILFCLYHILNCSTPKEKVWQPFYQMSYHWHVTMSLLTTTTAHRWFGMVVISEFSVVSGHYSGQAHDDM